MLRLPSLTPIQKCVTNMILTVGPSVACGQALVQPKLAKLDELLLKEQLTDVEIKEEVKKLFMGQDKSFIYLAFLLALLARKRKRYLTGPPPADARRRLGTAADLLQQRLEDERDGDGLAPEGDLDRRLDARRRRHDR